MTDRDANPQEPWPMFDLIEQTVAEWLGSWSPLPLPRLIEDVMLGELDGRITHRLVTAGLIDPEPCGDHSVRRDL